MKGLQKQGLVFGIFCFALLLVAPFFVLAQGETKTFFVDYNYDFSARKTVDAFLKKASQRAYFYLEKDWYNNLTNGERLQADKMVEEAALDFDNLIYPKLTAAFGSEWKGGIDNDERITIFFHQLKENGAGYIRTQDESPLLQAPGSNEREMLYINAQFLFQPIVKSLLAHEFTHLIEYNQKERLRGIEEDTWLSELRGEIAPTIVGYDNSYAGSNLSRRVTSFLDDSHDSLILWNNDPADYGVVALFGQYLLDHYGIKVLGDSLANNQRGIASLEQALSQNGFKQNFETVFTNFTLALLLNDCQLGDDYCFHGDNLKTIKVAPSLIILPNTQQTELSLRYQMTYWAGNWYRIATAGITNLTLNVAADLTGQFKVPYVLCQQDNVCQLSSLELDSLKRGKIILPEFGKQFRYLILAPSVQDRTINSQSAEKLFDFALLAKAESPGVTASTTEDQGIALLQAKIAELERQLAALRQQLSAVNKGVPGACTALSINLKFGQKGEAVLCLQGFLKNQGKEIYPEGLVTGYFGSATQRAVIRFQERYTVEILKPFGLAQGTGFVGNKTRAKINQMLSASF